METPAQLRKTLALLLAERATLKRRNAEIARLLHAVRVKLARRPDAGEDETTSQGSTIAPRDELDDLIDLYLND
jgi:hypothetical protein